MISAYTVCYAYKHYWDQSYFELNCTNKTKQEIKMIGNHMFTGRSSSALARSNESTPESVTGLYTQATNTTITLMWSRPAVPNGDIIGYQLHWDKGGDMCSVVINVDSDEVKNGDNCGWDLPERIVVNQKDMNYTISGLDHYKNYSMWVTPFTAVGSGPISNTTQHTTETRPGPVGIVTIRDIGPTAINVTWTIPEINPGPTNYTAVANSTIPGEEHIARCEVEVPGTPTSLHVDFFNAPPSACDTTKMRVTWTEPNLLDRHAYITRYNVQLNDEVFTYDVYVPKPFDPNNREFSFEQNGLKATWTYQWQLFAVGKNGVKGLPANFTFSTGICERKTREDNGIWHGRRKRTRCSQKRLKWMIGGGEEDELVTLQEIADPDRSIPIATYSEALADLHRDTHLILSVQYEGFHHQREFIATQGPLPGTIDDFWRMVWEQNVMVIVMLTQCKEGNRVKCEMYWPDTVQEAKQYGDVVVNPTSITNMNKFNINIFDISHASDLTKTRKVLQFHYLDFMDFTAAVEVDHFIEFVRTVRGHVPHDMTSPMVIHCSADVGRTGSYIAIDHLQEYLNSPKFSSDDHINIFDMVMEMREQRVNMVQTEAQYILIHDCFEWMLEDKKKSLKTTESIADLYANQAY
ncbi:PTPRB-like protein, partial [Mya arenaria]